MRQLILDLLPEAPPCLANFVAGSNAETLTGLAAWLSESGGEHSLFVWGESGAGKTHLLRAVGGVYIDAAQAGGLAEIEDPAARLYAVDNVEALGADEQIALFNLFNRLRAAGGKLLTSAQKPPLALALREDLRTRLGSGLIYRLQALSDDEQLAALNAQAAARGLPLPPEACSYLLARAPRDMRSLSALLAALDRYSLEHKRPITLPLLREVLHAPVQ
jgi:DnaA family protein